MILRILGAALYFAASHHAPAPRPTPIELSSPSARSPLVQRGDAVALMLTHAFDELDMVGANASRLDVETEPADEATKDREVSFCGLFGRERRGKNEGLGGFRAIVSKRWDGDLFLRCGITGLYLRDVGSDGSAAGFEIGARWYRPMSPRVRPFAQLAGGIFAASHNFPQRGTQDNFDYHGELGCSFRVARPAWIDVGIGFTHISNGFTHGRDRNPGTNNFAGFVGITFPY